MTCSDILIAATNLIAEETGEELRNSEFAARAPYIIASFCGTASVADRHYRKAFSLGTQPDFNRVLIGLDDQFPLCDRFFPAAVAYLASMLIATYNPDLSGVLRENARDSFAAAYGEIPWSTHGIINKNR